MNSDLIVEIAELAFAITKVQLDRDHRHDDDVAENILTIVRNGILAYEEHTAFEINTEMVKYET